MIFLLILLIFICVISLMLLVVTLKGSINAARQLLEYDKFYENTIEDIQEVVEFLNNLSKREVMSLDPDVIKLKKTIIILRDTLIGYINAGKKESKEGKEKK